MRVVITGASGFVGHGLAKFLCSNPDALGKPVSKLVLADLTPRDADQGLQGFEGTEWHCGDLTDAAYLDSLLKEPVDCLFHLASVPGSAAERKPDLGWSVNLSGSMALMERLARQGREGVRPPRVVFASSIAVYGVLGPGVVNEDCVPRPTISYGAHKLMTEILLADLSRRGEIDARSLRLPGIVGRPVSASGHGSAFMSLLFHKAVAREGYVCPVSRDATAWWMSLTTCVANLVWAARLDPATMPPSRLWQLPVLHASVGDIVAMLADRLGPESISGFRFVPDMAVESLFGRFPVLSAPGAKAAGFISDPDPSALVTQVLKGLRRPR